MKTPVVKRYDYIDYTIKNFTPNTHFYSGFRGGGRLEDTTDANGERRLIWPVGEPPGIYTLYADDDRGKTAEARVEVWQEVPPEGTISIDSDPPYCDVFIDERNIGKTPIKDYTVAAGGHTIRVHKDSTWSDWGQSFSINPGESKNFGTVGLASTVRRIYGWVINLSTGAGIPAAKVEFYYTYVYTDLLGWFDWINPPEYSGPITASASGYQSETQYITSPVSGGLRMVFLLRSVYG